MGGLGGTIGNWNAHLWLSGDSIVEQAVHCIDMMQWAMGDQLPLHAEGSGGRQVYDDPDKYGNIYDHFAWYMNGRTVPKDIISRVSKTEPSEVMR